MFKRVKYCEETKHRWFWYPCRRDIVAMTTLYAPVGIAHLIRLVDRVHLLVWRLGWTDIDREIVEAYRKGVAAGRNDHSTIKDAFEKGRQYERDLIQAEIERHLKNTAEN